jgi:dipeptidyl aminopeptidase/acylaminoacyl peptidase
MPKRTIITALLAAFALLAATAIQATAKQGAVIFSKSYVSEGADKGGLYAIRDGHLNQLTEDPTDTEPAFSPDGRTIAFVRDGDIYSVRPDGSGQRHLTSGAELDSVPTVAPNGRYVVFERRTAADAPADLYKVGALGGGLQRLTDSPAGDHDATFSPEGRTIVFVRSTVQPGGEVTDDLYSMRPSGAAPARLTKTGTIDEFEPRFFAGGILFSRGESSPGPSAYADIYTMRRNGTKVRSQVAGVGSAYVEDVTPDGRTLLFRRDQGLWVKRIGPGKARKLSQLPDGSKTNSVFSSDGRRVAAFVAVEDRESLVSIGVSSGHEAELAQGVNLTEGEGTTLGPVIAWQPSPKAGH